MAWKRWNSGKCPINGASESEVQLRVNELISRGWKQLTEIRRVPPRGNRVGVDSFTCMMESPEWGINNERKN